MGQMMNIDKSQSVVDLQALLERPTSFVWVEIRIEGSEYVTAALFKDTESAIDRAQANRHMGASLVFKMDSDALTVVYATDVGAIKRGSYLSKTLDGVANLPIDGCWFIMALDESQNPIEYHWWLTDRS